MRISDWSSDVCSSDLVAALERHPVDRVANAVYRHDRGLLYALDPDVQGAAVAGTVRLGLSRCGLAVAGRLGSGRAAAGAAVAGLLLVVLALAAQIEAEAAGIRLHAGLLKSRSEARRVGKEGGSKVKSRWSPEH